MKRKAHLQGRLAAQASFEKYGRKSKREQFLDEMNKVVSWTRLLALVEPHYPKAGNGRRPAGLEVMLRAYFVQQWTKAKIKGIMSEVFQHAIRYGWLNDGENPIFAVRQSTKRVRVMEPLEVAEFRALMLALSQKMRVIGIVAATTGLRISEVLGLKWVDIDWKTLQMGPLHQTSKIVR